jgi:hypothetical protein
LAAVSCARDLYVEWSVEDDPLTALDKGVEVGVEFAEVGDG